MIQPASNIPSFNSFGWEIEQGKREEIIDVLGNFRDKRAKKNIPIFSIIDSDDDIQDIIKTSKFFINSDIEINDFILIGTGGSNLGAEALIEPLEKKNKINFHVIDNIETNKLLNLLEKVDANKTKILAVSKSGNTIETISLLLILCEWMLAKGNNLNNSVLVMSERKLKNKKNIILDIAKEKNISSVRHEESIGGRFSSLTSTGLLQATVMGANPFLIRKSARTTLDYILEEKNFFNLGSGFFLNDFPDTTKLNCIMGYGDFLEPLIRWYRQLWSESLGKKGNGIFFVSAKGPVDQHSQMQMWLDGPNIGLYSILLSSSDDAKINIPQSKFLPWSRSYTLDNLSNVMAYAAYDSLKSKNRPVRMINMPSRNSESIASLMVIFLVEVLVLAELKKINPYGQAAVEDIKVKTFSRLNK